MRSFSVAEYQLTSDSDHVIRASDGAWIPNHEGNRDWQEYQDWLDQGGVPDPYVPLPDPPQPPDANARLDTGVHDAVSAYDANTPPASAPAGGQGGMTADERLLRLEETIKALCNGHMAYSGESAIK
jgi:hypothetical protein